MEATFAAPIFKTHHQDRPEDSRDITIKTSKSILNSKGAFLNQNQSYVKKDALFAVKLDPAVLEAQITIGQSQEDYHQSVNNASTSITDDEKYENTPQTDTVPASSVQSNKEFDAMLSMQRAALQSLSSQQFDLLLRYVHTLRKQRVSVQKHLECRFCKNNGHPTEWYSNHTLKDSRGRVRCPVLRSVSCRRCGATGDNAHTFKYCPAH